MIASNKKGASPVHVHMTGLLCALVAILLSFALTPPVAFAEGPAQIAVGSSGEVQAGQEFTVPVTLDNNPGIAGATFVLNYDSDVLQLVGVSGEGGIIKTTLMADPTKNNNVGFILFPGDMADNGLLFNATFKVKDTAITGTYEIALALKDDLDKNFVNSDADAVPVDFTAGFAAVEGTPAGGDTGGTGDTGGAGDGAGDGAGGTGGTGGTGGAGDTGGTDGTGGAGGGITTPDGKPVTDTVDVNAPDPSTPQPVSNGTPFFVNAEEGSLTWDTNVLDGYYDADAGGYVLTPKASGDTALTYTDKDGNEKTIELTIADAAAPLTANRQETGVDPLLIGAIIAAVLVIAIVAVVIVRRRRNEAPIEVPIGKHSAE